MEVVQRQFNCTLECLTASETLKDGSTTRTFGKRLSRSRYGSWGSPGCGFTMQLESGCSTTKRSNIAIIVS